MLIEKAGTGGYSHYRIPGIVITDCGTLLACYECRPSYSDWANIDIKIIRSTDGGENWQTVALFPGNGETLNNPVFFVNGDVLHFLFLKNYRVLFHCVSRDDGVSFSVPKEVPIVCDWFYNALAIGPGHGIVHGGNMLVPIWFAQNREDLHAHHPSVVAVLYSEDGECWQVGAGIGEGVLMDPSECALAVTADNRVLISIRNENPCRQRAFALSDNGIDGWEDLHFDARMPDPICMGSMCHENGTVYHINCASSSARENLTVNITRDGFAHFESLFVDTPAGYSDMAVRDGVLYILYERDAQSGGLYFKRMAR